MDKLTEKFVEKHGGPVVQSGGWKLLRDGASMLYDPYGVRLHPPPSEPAEAARRRLKYAKARLERVERLWRSYKQPDAATGCYQYDFGEYPMWEEKEYGPLPVRYGLFDKRKALEVLERIWKERKEAVDAETAILHRIAPNRL